MNERTNRSSLGLPWLRLGLFLLALSGLSRGLFRPIGVVVVVVVVVALPKTGTTHAHQPRCNQPCNNIEHIP